MHNYVLYFLSGIVLLDQKFSRKPLEVFSDIKEFFLEVNEEMMKQVWINLLNNEAKLSSAVRKIEISMKRTVDNISVKISNQGAEMPPETKVHIIDKFFRGDLSHSASSNGLGLATVKKSLTCMG